MEEESGEMHSEDDKVHMEKNRKRIVKTPAQVQALEKFYNEHKYPSESMKLEVAESIGLTEKQVSGWFCHRRLKDKRLMNEENHTTGKQDRSSGVVQDRGSGHKQDSCGSTKLGENRNFETREVESGRELSAAEPTYERHGPLIGNYNPMDDASSGSSSSLRNMSSHHSDDPIDVKCSRYPITKFNSDLEGVKPRRGPSGYLKLKGQAENSAITSVKQQLGKHYREDGPPLGVDFDPLPPGAFESSMQDPVDETYFSGEAIPCAPPDVSKIHQHSMFDKGHEYNSRMVSRNSNMDGRSFRTKPGSDAPYNQVHQKISQGTSLPCNSGYYTQRNSSAELPEGTTRDFSGSESKDYKIWPHQRLEKVDSVSSHHHLQPHDGNTRIERVPRFHKYNNVVPGENTEKISNLTMKGYEHDNAFDRGLPKQIIKDGQAYAERKIINENRVAAPFKNNTHAPKRMRDEFHQQPHVKRSSVVENQPGSYPIMRSRREVPSSFSEDKESVETNSSTDQ